MRRALLLLRSSSFRGVPQRWQRYALPSLPHGGGSARSPSYPLYGAAPLCTSVRLCHSRPPTPTTDTTTDSINEKENNTTDTNTTTNEDTNEKEIKTTMSAAALRAALSRLSPEDQRLFEEAFADPASQKPSVLGGPGIGPKSADMAAALTCGRCDFRMVKRFSKHAYTKGIVIVECPHCRVRHLLADHLGWVVQDGEKRTVEDFLKEKGEQFIRISGEGGTVDYVWEPPGDGEETTEAAGAGAATTEEIEKKKTKGE